jgi:hypothetical protein
MEVTGDICLRRPRSTQGCRAAADDDGGDGVDYDDESSVVVH